MDTATPPAPDPYAGGIEPSGGGSMPGCVKLLLGCGAVVLVLALIVGGLVMWGLSRLHAPPEPVAPSKVVTEEARGWVRMESALEDPGLRALAAEIVEESQRLDRQELPEWFRTVDEMASAGDAQGIGWWLPRGAILALEPPVGGAGEGDALPAAVMAVEMGAGARLVGLMFGFVGMIEDRSREEAAAEGAPPEPEELIEIGGGNGVLLDDGGALISRRGSLLWASDRERLEALVARLEAGEEAATPLPGLDRLGEGGWDLYGRLDNREGALDGLLGGAADYFQMGEAPRTETDSGGSGSAELAMPAPSAVRELTFRLDVVSAEETKGELTLEAADESQAEAWRRALAAHFAELEDEHEALSTRFDGRVEGSRLEARWELHGVAEAFRRGMRQAAEAAEAEQPAPGQEPEDGTPQPPEEAPRP